jgi:ABC-type nitrate/sulfonate/bicarbonate transport system substrate-binding protein
LKGNHRRILSKLVNLSGESGLKAYPFDAVAKKFLFASWFATSPWAASHPDLVKRFDEVMRETAVWANKNQAQSAAILAK